MGKVRTTTSQVKNIAIFSNVVPPLLSWRFRFAVVGQLPIWKNLLLGFTLYSSLEFCISSTCPLLSSAALLSTSFWLRWIDITTNFVFCINYERHIYRSISCLTILRAIDSKICICIYKYLFTSLIELKAGMLSYIPIQNILHRLWEIQFPRASSSVSLLSVEGIDELISVLGLRIGISDSLLTHPPFLRVSNGVNISSGKG